MSQSGLWFSRHVPEDDGAQVDPAHHVPAAANGPAIPGPDPVEFLPLESRARWVVWALVLIAILDAAALVSDYLDYDLRDRIVSGGAYTQADVDASDLRQGVVALLALAAWVLAVVLFIRWFRRAYRNLRAVGGLQRYREGWTIGAWFVPILNLFRPKQLTNDIWRGSDPATPWRESDATERVPPLVQWWWGLFLASWWLGSRATLASLSGDSARSLRSADGYSIASDVLDVAAALLAIALVRAVTARQTARAVARGGA